MDFIKNLLKPPPTIQERVKEMQKNLNQEVRNIEKQIRKIENEEKKVKIEAKKVAKQNKLDCVRILAKEMVNSRKAVTRLFRAKTQINTVIMQLNIQLSQINIAKTMQKSTNIMKAMNSLCKVPQISMVMHNLSSEMIKMNLIEETINDNMDDIFDDVEDTEIDEEVSKVVDELLINVKNSQLPTYELPNENKQNEVEQIDNTKDKDAELEKRLGNLKSY